MKKINHIFFITFLILTSCTFNFRPPIESLAIADYSKRQDVSGSYFEIEIYELDLNMRIGSPIFSETVKIKSQLGNNGIYGYTKFNIGSKIKSNSSYRIYLYDTDNDNDCYFINSNKRYVDFKFDPFGKYVIQFDHKNKNAKEIYFEILEDDLG